MIRFDMEKWQQREERLRLWLDLVWLKIDARSGHLMKSWKEEGERPEEDFVADADRHMIYQEPLRARILLRVAGAVVLIFILWAALSSVDEVTRGEGKVIPSRQLQVLQSLDGGIVSEISVKEGQIVEAGQPLLKVDSTRFESSLRENRSQYFSLLAKAARLRSLTEGSDFVVPPEFGPEDMQLADEERRLYMARASELNAQVSIARQQMLQRQQELVEAQAKREQASQAFRLSARELDLTRPLLDSGAVSEVELMRLERDVTRFRGERDMAAAQISRSQSAIAEANRKIQEVELNFRNEAGKELAETMAKLGALSEGNVGLEDRVKHSVIRSPMKGTVKRLLVNTVGGVVQPGKDLVEVVPLEDILMLEAKVLPRDIAFLRPGQKAIVKFTAYDFAIYGGLDATLDQIGADSLADERGNAYYIVRVHTNKPYLGDNLPIIPGMVAEVDIITGKKSILAYLLKPVLRAKEAAFTER